jgi:hypothetical protein
MYDSRGHWTVFCHVNCELFSLCFESVSKMIFFEKVFLFDNTKTNLPFYTADQVEECPE